MKTLHTLILLALLVSVGSLVRPAARAQQSSQTMTLSVTLVQHVDVLQKAAQSYTLTQTPAPSTRPQVFVNGILMCDVCALDYVVSGTTITFTGQQTGTMDTPVIQVWYWAMN